MTRDEIMQKLVDSSYIERNVRKMCYEKDDSWKDFAQEIWVIVLSYKAEAIESLYAEGGMQKVCAFVSGIIRRQLTLANSVINYNYRLHGSREVSVEKDMEGEGCMLSMQEFEKMCDIYLNDWERYAMSTFRECGYDPEETAKVCGVSKRIVDLVMAAIVAKLKKGVLNDE